METMSQWTHYVVQYPVSFLVLISVLVFVHEFGHYWVARRCGVRIEKFSIGFGPELFGWDDSHGTHWRIALLPLGGYVKMFGDADPASSPDKDAIKSMTDEEKKVSFFYQHVAKRAAVVIAGPLANYLFAWVVLALVYVFVGQPFTTPRVESLVDKMPAVTAGIKAGDVITSVNGSPIQRFEELQQYVRLRPDQTITLTAQRAGETKSFTLKIAKDSMTDRFGQEHPIGMIGLRAKGMDFIKHDPASALYYAVKETIDVSKNTLMAMGQIIMGERSSSELGGPLRIAQMSGEMMDAGFVPWIMLMVLISVNLGFINLFPIPVLDGGHLAFYAFEAIIGKPVSIDAQEIGYKIGTGLVLMLMVFAFWNDLVQLKVISYLRSLIS
jgi:regulator of sigma E protease